MSLADAAVEMRKTESATLSAALSEIATPKVNV